MPDRRMTLCNRLIGGIFDRLDTLTSFWQTPREVEWAKAAADGLAEREAEVDVAEPRCGPNGPQCDDKWCMYCVPMVAPKTSAPTPGAVDGPAEGEPPEPSAVVGPNSPKWIRDLIEATEDFVGAPRGHFRNWPDYAWPDGAPSAEVESPASVPSAESPAPEFDWVTTAIPVIAGVLAEHVPSACGNVVCFNEVADVCGEFADWQDWRAHVAPHIAARLQTVCTATVYDFASGDRPRPLADFPKHQNPRM